MPNQARTVWQDMQSRGYMRRDFNKLCALLAASAGLEATMLPKVAWALEHKPRPPVLWFHFQECTCCSESFIRASHPLVADILLDNISLDYTQTLQAAAGEQAEAAVRNTMEKYPGQYLMLIEGSIPIEADGVYCCIGGRTALDIVSKRRRVVPRRSSRGAAAPATAASRPHAPTRPARHHYTESYREDRSSRCRGARRSATSWPPSSSTCSPSTAFRSSTPSVARKRSTRSACTIRAFAAPTTTRVCSSRAGTMSARPRATCLYKMGCRGPTTYNACSVTRWNGGTSYPIQSGHGCIGCSEEKFWDNGPYAYRLPSATNW